MRINRIHRRWIATLLLGALLFTQLAAAAYACLQWSSFSDSASAAVSTYVSDDCAELDLDRSQVCKAHCDKPAQSSGTAQPFDHSPAPSVAFVIAWADPWLIAPDRRINRSPRARLSSPDGAPPIYLLNQVLRN